MIAAPGSVLAMRTLGPLCKLHLALKKRLCDIVATFSRAIDPNLRRQYLDILRLLLSSANTQPIPPHRLPTVFNMPSRSRSPEDYQSRSRGRSLDSRPRTKSRSVSRRRSPSRDSRSPVPRRNGRYRDSRSRSLTRSRSRSRDDRVRSPSRGPSRGRSRSRSESPLRSTKVCHHLDLSASAIDLPVPRLLSSVLPRTSLRIICARSLACTVLFMTWTSH